MAMELRLVVRVRAYRVSEGPRNGGGINVCVCVYLFVAYVSVKGAGGLAPSRGDG